MNTPIFGKSLYKILAQQLGLPQENVVRCYIEMDCEDIARITVETLLKQEDGDRMNVRKFGLVELTPPRERRKLSLKSTYKTPETK